MDKPNLEHWETLASFHGTGADRIYDVDALVAGQDSTGDVEESALDFATRGRGVAGLDVIHIQSHIGFDSVTMARRGARVTAVDFSPTALARAQEIATLAGVSLETVEADSRELPRSLDNRFDLAYATIGVLCWIDDVDKWMACAAQTLRTGGRLVIVEIHPLMNVFASSEPLVADFAYGGAAPNQWTGSGSYANLDADFITSSEEYAHSLGEIVNAALQGGLTPLSLIEHDSLGFDPRGNMLHLDGDGRYRFRVGVGADGTSASASALPIAYTLVAEKS